MKRALSLLSGVSVLGACAIALADPIAPAPAGALPQSPVCSQPARLEGQFNPRVPNLLVTLRAGIEPVAAAHRLARKYGLTIGAMGRTSLGFLIKDIDLKIVHLLQCEPDISVMAFDAVVAISMNGPNKRPSLGEWDAQTGIRRY